MPPLHHVAHDARDQRVAAWLRREPALPFELVEGRVEPLPAEARAAAKRLTRHPPADDRGDRERALRLGSRSEEHTSELQSPCNLVCRLLLEKKKINEI